MHPAYLLLHNPPLAIEGHTILGQWVGPHGRDRATPHQIDPPLQLHDEYGIVGVLLAYPELTASNTMQRWELPHQILLNLLVHHTPGKFQEEFVRHCKMVNSPSMYCTAIVRTTNDRWAELHIHTNGTWEMREFYNSVLYQNGRFLNQEALNQQLERNYLRQKAMVDKLFTTTEPEGFIMPTLEP